MNVVIIEDEPLSADRLGILLLEINPEIEIIQKIESIKRAVSFFKASPEKVDLIFMDVELADGVCFEIFQEIRIDSPIIFTTAYDQYAIRAFDLNSIHYLLKPVSIELLSNALKKFIHQRKANTIDLLSVSELIKGSQSNFKEHFLGKFGNKLVHKASDKISYFYSEDKMVYLVDDQKKKYLIDYNLDELSDKLLDPKRFFRVSRKFIVNINYIEILKKYINQRLQLFLDIKQEHEIVVSRERVAAFKTWLNK